MSSVISPLPGSTHPCRFAIPPRSRSGPVGRSPANPDDGQQQDDLVGIAVRGLDQALTKIHGSGPADRPTSTPITATGPASTAVPGIAPVDVPALRDRSHRRRTRSPPGADGVLACTSGSIDDEAAGGRFEAVEAACAMPSRTVRNGAATVASVGEEDGKEWSGRLHRVVAPQVLCDGPSGGHEAEQGPVMGGPGSVQEYQVSSAA